MKKVPKDPAISENAEDGVFAYVQADAARSGRMSGSVDEAWTGSWDIAAGEVRERVRTRTTARRPHPDDGHAGETTRSSRGGAAALHRGAPSSGMAPSLAVASDAVHLLNLLGRQHP